MLFYRARLELKSNNHVSTKIALIKIVSYFTLNCHLPPVITVQRSPSVAKYVCRAAGV